MGRYGGSRPGAGVGGRPGGSGGLRGRIRAQAATLETRKNISYSTTGQKIFSISSDTAGSSTEEPMPTRVSVSNIGGVPAIIMTGYREWTSETADAGSAEGRLEYLHTMLMPGESYSPPVRAIIRTGETDGTESRAIMDGTPADNVAPSVTANFAYSDSGTTIDDASFEAADTSITVDDGDFFRVNDLIQFGINTTTATKIEICRVTAISTNVLTLERALYGTTANDKDAQTNATSGVVDNAKVYFPFFNAYHDYNKYTVAQTDSNGRFKCMNFFGLGRAASGVCGIVPGSVAIKFYKPGYQELGLSGVTSSTTTSLLASGSYWFKIAIDGGTAESINFTTDSSNLNWGGTNGVISKMQAALDDKYNNSTANTFQQKSTVGIVNGDVRFTSGQSLSTSAIALTAGVDGASATYNLFSQQNGHIPALANLDAAVAARLPDDVSYDNVTYVTSTNSSIFVYDNGWGNLSGAGNGTINYETGAIDMTGCPANAEFVYSALHTSAFSGKLNEGTDERINSIVDIYGNTTNQKWNAIVRIRAT